MASDKSTSSRDAGGRGSSRARDAGGRGPSRIRGSVRPATHYEVLGVAPAAAHAEVRQAYYRAARRWHPDQFAGGSAVEAEEAEVQMRRVNEAWSVLGTADRRRAYDRELDGVRSTTRSSSAGYSNVDGVIRVDPRLLDPEVLHARRYAQSDEISNRSSAILRVAPVLALLGLLAAIFVFTAYARSGRGSATTTTFPGPGLGAGIEAGTCVSVIGGPSLLARPCDANADGVVIGARQPDGACPLGTSREVELTNGAIACLGSID